MLSAAKHLIAQVLPYAQHRHLGQTCSTLSLINFSEHRCQPDPTSARYTGLGRTGLAARSLLQRQAVAFLPLLVLYIWLVVRGVPPDFQFDETFYVEYAANIARGDLSLAGTLDLWWGPGYPLVLAPFLWLQLPLIAPRLFNACLLFGAVVVFYLTLRSYCSARGSVVAAYLFGLYPPMLQRLTLLMSEPLAYLLLAASVYYGCCVLRSDPPALGNLLISSLLLALLALTKVIFGYVFLAQLVLFALFYLWKRSALTRSAVLIYALALLATTPYLLFTYSLTGKPFYWGSSGGMSLYWMSTPFRDELGDWRSEDAVRNNQVFARHHGEFFRSLEGQTALQRDEEFKSKAVSNIRDNPAKYAQNILYNVGRLLFSYPYTNERPTLANLLYAVPNTLILALAAASAALSLLRRRSTPPEINVHLLLFACAFAASSLLSAYPRQFSVLLPPLAVWIVTSLPSSLSRGDTSYQLPVA